MSESLGNGEILESLPKSRPEAKACGSDKYFTGKPCKHGHVDIRETKNGTCKTCRNLYYKNNSERIKIAVKSYRIAIMNSSEERIASYKKKKAEYAAKKRKSDQAFLERQRLISRKNVKLWKLNNRDRYLASVKSSKAKRRGAVGKFTSDDVAKILENQQWLCVECKTDLKLSGYHIDHIVPVSKGGANWPSNLQCLCAPCNLAKGSKMPEEWEAEKIRSSNG